MPVASGHGCLASREGQQSARGDVITAGLGGAIGGGGLGDLAIRYGYYRYQTEVMVFIVIMLSIMVIGIQASGNWIATRLDKR